MLPLRLAVLLAPPSMAAQHPHLLFLDRRNIQSADPRLALRVQEPARGPWVLSPTEPWEAHMIGGADTIIAGNG
eukprot:COSAG04_NODE_14396_length_569_cov_258.055389_2_plen_73_part_01